MPRLPLRWLVVGTIVLSSTLNYLDRQLLAAAAPTLKSEFHLNNTQYGQVGSVFSIGYALVAPLAGLFIDRVGLSAGVSIAVIVWSLAAAATGATHTLPAFLACRALLGIAEAAGIPATGKAFATYLPPGELALGTASNQIGISIGASAAPLLLATMAPVYGWRTTFVLCGALGFLWVPVWWWVAMRRIAVGQVLTCPEHSSPPSMDRKPIGTPLADLFHDRQFYGVVATAVFIMMLYALWTNWTTIYLVQQHHLTQDEANRRFTWIPPVFATLGGFAGGGIMYFWIRRGVAVVKARIRLCSFAAIILLVTAAVPLMPAPELAIAVISLSFFLTVAISVAVYALPIDLFGAARAGFCIAALTCAYGLMQAVLLPVIGMMVDRFGFGMVCAALSLSPLAGVGILRWSLRDA